MYDFQSDEHYLYETGRGVDLRRGIEFVLFTPQVSHVQAMQNDYDGLTSLAEKERQIALLQTYYKGCKGGADFGRRDDDIARYNWKAWITPRDQLASRIFCWAEAKLVTLLEAAAQLKHFNIGGWAGLLDEAAMIFRLFPSTVYAAKHHKVQHLLLA